MLSIPGVVKVSFFFDIAHVKHMGVHRSLIASSLVYFCETGHLILWCIRSGTPASQTDSGMVTALKCAYAHYRQWTRLKRKAAVTEHPFSLSRLGRTNAESLPPVAGWVKAMHLKNMVSWLVDFVVEEFGAFQGDTYWWFCVRPPSFAPDLITCMFARDRAYGL